MNELVTIVIPTYKNRGRLRGAILSALEQSYTNIEVIVVDDNKPESDERASTEVVMGEFYEDKRVVFIQHPKNMNGAAARNTGIRASKGTFIAFLDDDDSFLPQKLERQVSYLNMHPEVEAVYCFAGRNGKRYGDSNYEGNATRELLMLQTCMYTPTLMFRRDSLLAINGFDETFRRNQDYDLLLRFFHAGYKIGCLQEILSEIGTNEGENALSGEKLEETKKYFFEKFQPYIREIDKTNPGFKNKVLAKHYAGVFLTQVKTGNYKMALRDFRHFFKAPVVFCRVLISSIKQHLKGSSK